MLEITAQEKNKINNGKISDEICKRTKIALSDWEEFMLTFKMRSDSTKLKKFLTGIFVFTPSAIKSAYDDYLLNYGLKATMRNCSAQEKSRRFVRYLTNAEAQVKDIDADLSDDVNGMTSSYNVIVKDVSDIELEHEIKRLEDEID